MFADNSSNLSVTNGINLRIKKGKNSFENGAKLLNYTDNKIKCVPTNKVIV